MTMALRILAALLLFTAVAATNHTKRHSPCDDLDEGTCNGAAPDCRWALYQEVDCDCDCSWYKFWLHAVCNLEMTIVGCLEYSYCELDEVHTIGICKDELECGSDSAINCVRTTTLNSPNPDWMDAIDDATSLTALSIPGTHDTMAFYGFKHFTYWSINNVWPLRTQLDAGIRFIDIRPRQIEDELNIYHGIAPQFSNFNDVLDTLCDFFTGNPSEAVLMRVRQEGTRIRPVGTYADLVQDYIDSHECSDMVITQTTVPTLGESRGKVVLIRDFEGTMGIPWSSLVLVDSEYIDSITQQGIENEILDKWNDFLKPNLEDAIATDPNDLYLSFPTGAGPFADPLDAAEIFNPLVHDYLENEASLGDRLGMIAMDFPGEDVIQAIVDSNFS